MLARVLVKVVTMKVINKIMSLVLSLMLTLLVSVSFAYEKLPIPRNLILLDSKEGEALFNSSFHARYWGLANHFVTESGLTYCGVASAVMVLNASGQTPPITPSHAPYRIFDQVNFFSPAVLKITTPSKVAAQGMSLEELFDSLKTFNQHASIHYAAETKVDGFRKVVIAAMRSGNSDIIVNFNRKIINEQGAGHFSPIAAYDVKTDKVLMLDVARYKYPPVWVSLSELFDAMALNDDRKIEKKRGFIVFNTPL